MHFLNSGLFCPPCPYKVLEELRRWPLKALQRNQCEASLCSRRYLAKCVGPGRFLRLREAWPLQAVTKLPHCPKQPRQRYVFRLSCTEHQTWGVQHAKPVQWGPRQRQGQRNHETQRPFGRLRGCATLELGNEKRLPLAPADNKNAPMLAAMPVHKVDTSGLMKFMVS